MIAHIRPNQLQEWLAGAEPGALPLLLDVREPWERQTASVRCAGLEVVAIPMGSIAQQLATLDPQRPVACLCHHGARSLRVAAFLEHNGFDRVANISGGIDAWSRELDPSVPLY